MFWKKDSKDSSNQSDMDLLEQAASSLDRIRNQDRVQRLAEAPLTLLNSYNPRTGEFDVNCFRQGRLCDEPDDNMEIRVNSPSVHLPPQKPWWFYLIVIGFITFISTVAFISFILFIYLKFFYKIPEAGVKAPSGVVKDTEIDFKIDYLK